MSTSSPHLIVITPKFQGGHNADDYLV
uniref:Uncharacterized protein n=1 Tax=Anguilla anguilla TaxID=7936 RepID=A0A0E9U140_ANGAN